MAKKAKKDGKKKTVGRCPECNGPQRGRNAHEPTCSRYKGGSTGRASGGSSTGRIVSIDMRRCRGMSASELLGFKEAFEADVESANERIHEMIEERKQEEIAELEAKLKALKKA